MSFRSRLTLFFVVLVIVPMIAVTVILFQLIDNNETGKTNANVMARAQVATRVYASDAGAAQTAAAAQAIARDPSLGRALSADRVAAARATAQRLLGTSGAARIALARGPTTVFDVGDRSAIAPTTRQLVGTGGRSLGLLSVSTTTAADYVGGVASLTGLRVVVRQGANTLASDLPGVSAGALPAPGGSRQQKVNGVTYQATTFTAPSFGSVPARISLLADLAPIRSSGASARLIAGIIIGAFFLIAIGFAILLSRSLQLQIDGFLVAARRLASGDFSTQVPIVGRDELAQLGIEFNKMSRELEERLHELRDQQTRWEGALRRIGETFASNLDRDGLLEIMVHTSVDGVGATAGRASVRLDDGLEERVRVGVLPSHEAALRDVEEKALRTAQPASSDRDGVSALGHPLAVAQSSEGVLGLLAVARTDRPFNDAERELFHYLAGQAAVSIENVDLHERVQHQAVTDDLTGLSNHRHFQDSIAAELERARRFDQSLGLIMLDIDDFKTINDTYGHQQGDLVLKEVARVLNECSREIDFPARYGGEEMALLLPGTDSVGASSVGERVRRGIEDLRVPGTNGEPLRVTASLGVASVVPDETYESRQLIAAADAALYEAKRAGKNRTVAAQ